MCITMVTLFFLVFCLVFYRSWMWYFQYTHKVNAWSIKINLIYIEYIGCTILKVSVKANDNNNRNKFISIMTTELELIFRLFSNVFCFVQKLMNSLRCHRTKQFALLRLNRKFVVIMNTLDNFFNWMRLKKKSQQ